VREAEAVARAKKIPVSADPVAMVEEVCRKTAENISSMLQDVRKKRPTEIAAINGEIIKEAGLLGLQAPINTELLQRVKDIETLSNL
jgi:2-dehydropantoate 2-reductase